MSAKQGNRTKLEQIRLYKNAGSSSQRWQGQAIQNLYAANLLIKAGFETGYDFFIFSQILMLKAVALECLLKAAVIETTNRNVVITSSDSAKMISGNADGIKIHNLKKLANMAKINLCNLEQKMLTILCTSMETGRYPITADFLALEERSWPDGGYSSPEMWSNDLEDCYKSFILKTEILLKDRMISKHFYKSGTSQWAGVFAFDLSTNINKEPINLISCNILPIHRK